MNSVDLGPTTRCRARRDRLAIFVYAFFLANSKLEGYPMIRGSCLCGSVRYEIRGPLGRVTHCHCSMCRKVHGAAFGTYARVNDAEFAWTQGEGDIATYRSSQDVQRTFCRRCGSTLQFIRESRPEGFALAMGTLDDDPGVRPSRHIFVDSKAPWFEIHDELPQHRAYT